MFSLGDSVGGSGMVRIAMERSEFLLVIWEAYERGELIPMCAWCQRVHLKGEWVVAPPGTLETIDRPMMLSHSICPACAADPPASPKQVS
jgi:hypothetical protein